MPDIPVKIMMNGHPDQAFAFSRLPNAGVGLARLEFIINRRSASTESPPRVRPAGGAAQGQVAEAVAAYPSPRDFFVTARGGGGGHVGGAFAPHR